MNNGDRTAEAAAAAISRTQLFIAGEFRPGAAGGELVTINPATTAPLATVAAADAQDVDAAVAAARRAGPAWRALPLADRARLLRRVAELIERDRVELARLETLDTGKPYADVLDGDVLEAAEWFDFFADMGKRLRSSVIPSLPGYLNYTLREPYGVVGLVIPWNYPLALCGTKVAPALAMGNTVVLKPAEDTPLTALALADICREAGVPDGVLNVVPGYGEIAGRALVQHPGVDMISFTGSTSVGKEIMARAAANLTPVVLELGGKSPNIVFADADIAAAAATATFTFCVNQGQLCTAGTRLLLEAPIHDEFLQALLEQVDGIRVGDPFDPATQLGAVISEKQMQRIERYVRAGDEAGAVRHGGGRVEGDGLFCRPAVFSGVTSDMAIAREEIFGPVLSVIRFVEEQDATRIANDTSYGLAAGVWTSDLQRAHRLTSAVEAGLIYVNTMNVTSPGSPYGGYKHSGVGVEGGNEQAESMSRVKSVWVNVEGDAPRF